MMTKIITKIVLPLFIFLLGFSAGMYVHTKAVKPCPVCPQCPSLKCPDVQTQSIDMDKVKGFKGNFTVNQAYTVKMDSAMYSSLRGDIKDMLDERLKELNVVRCKK